MSPYLLSSGEGKATWFLNARVTEKAVATQTGGAFSLTEQLLPPSFATPYHVHHAEDEAFYVAEGEIEFELGDQRVSVTVGGFLFAPREVPHGFRAVGEQVTKLLVWTSPAGFEQFVVDTGQPATADGLPVPTTPDFVHLTAVAARYHIDILGPLPA